MIRVLIADDHPIVRRGMMEIVSRAGDFSIVGEAGNIQEVIDLLSTRKTEILLLDLNMPGKHGLDALKDIVSRFSALKILIMSAYPEEHFAKRALRAGAFGYLSKDAAPEHLVTALRKIAQGGHYVSEPIAEQLATQIHLDHSERPHDHLSDRELQVLLFIASGKTLTEIAEKLSLSPKTVSTYRTRLLEKLQLKTNADITRYAIEQKLIDTTSR